MTLGGFLMLLLIAGICGSIAQAIAGYSRGGCLVSIILGFVGAILGSWIARQLGMHEYLSIDVGGERFPVIWSVIGAALFVAILNMMRPRRNP